VEYGYENYFSGKAKTNGKLSWIEPKKGEKIWFMGKYSGHINCVIQPERIELFPASFSKKELNCFYGKVVRMELEKEGIAKIKVSGELDFRVKIPVKELEGKGIGLSSSVLIRFPPEAVEVFE